MKNDMLVIYMDVQNYIADTSPSEALGIASGICYFIFTLSHVSVVVFDQCGM